MPECLVRVILERTTVSTLRKVAVLEHVSLRAKGVRGSRAVPQGREVRDPETD